MSNVSQIVQRARIQGGLTTLMADNDEVLGRLNDEYKIMWDMIVNLDKNYGWDTWITDITAGSNEYSFQLSTAEYISSAGSASAYTLNRPRTDEYTNNSVIYVRFHVTNNINATINVNDLGAKKIYLDPSTQITASYFDNKQVYGVLQYDDTLDGGNGGYLVIKRKSASFGIYKPEKVSIKYRTTSDFVDCPIKDWNNFTVDMGEYERGQPQSSPFCVLSDNSIFVYPTPDQSVANGLKLEGIKEAYDLTIDMTQDDILIPYQYHKVLYLSLIPYVYEKRKKYEESFAAQNKYEKARDEMLDQLAMRKVSNTQGTTKSFKHLE